MASYANFKVFSSRCEDSYRCWKTMANTSYRFMCADALWTLAMACNVYLTFYYKFDAEKLRTMEKWYFLGCYGVPFIPALVYIFIDTNGHRMYGNATLWCWVSGSYDYMRIATFYGPVWFVCHPNLCVTS